VQRAANEEAWAAAVAQGEGIQAAAAVMQAKEAGGMGMVVAMVAPEAAEQKARRVGKKVAWAVMAAKEVSLAELTEGSAEPEAARAGTKAMGAEMRAMQAVK
jgi:hypothetical protein